MAVPRVYTDKISSAMANVGRAAISMQYPNEFEYYLMGLELVNSKGITEEFLVFPVMPTQISKVENNRTTIKKSASGVTVLYSDSPTPNDLTIKGNFGKSFKLLTKYDKGGENFSYGFSFGQMSFKTPDFDASVKTGFGVIKILQRIVNNSGKLDSSGNPRRLYMYNMALGENYLCVVPNGGLTLSQDYDKNMIWEYSLNLSLIANLEDLNPSKKQSSSSDLLNSIVIQQGISSIVGSVLQTMKGASQQILPKV